MRQTILAVCVLSLAAACSAGVSTTTSAPGRPATTTSVAETTVPTITTTVPPAPTSAPPSVTTSTTAPPPASPDFSPDARRARMLGDLAVLLAFGPREAGTDPERFAAMHLQRELAGAGLAVSTEPVPLPNGRESRNVWATIGAGDTHLLVGAHFDTKRVSPGADDNGSGTVVVLELARRLAEEPPAGLRTTIVFFGAEEILDGFGPNDHHYGSRRVAARLGAAGALPDFMVSVDNAGIAGEMVVDSFRDANPAMAERMRTAATAVGVDVTLGTSGDISDHEAFARAGVPAALLWRPGNPAYHTAGDTEVNPDWLAENLAVLEQMLADLTQR